MQVSSHCRLQRHKLFSLRNTLKLEEQETYLKQVVTLKITISFWKSLNFTVVLFKEHLAFTTIPWARAVALWSQWHLQISSTSVEPPSLVTPIATQSTLTACRAT